MASLGVGQRAPAKLFGRGLIIERTSSGAFVSPGGGAARRRRLFSGVISFRGLRCAGLRVEWRLRVGGGSGRKSSGQLFFFKLFYLTLHTSLGISGNKL